jgi:hypothetical protein
MTNRYEMYTEFGDDAVDAVVRHARVLKLDWPAVYAELETLSHKFDGQFGECMDTAVRESVYDELGFKTKFYL